ncbi:MAG: methyltransferase family protein [Alphaproteobacteria bacterium]
MADHDKAQTDPPAPVAPVAPPPVFFGAAFLIGLVLQWLVPLARWQAGLWAFIGAALLLAGAVVAVWGFRALRAAETTIHVHQVSSSLVDRGPYGLSRNPLYVALILLYLGVAFSLGLLWPVLLLLPATVLVQILVIQREEARLEEWFGQAYLDYKARVRRWI